MPDDTALLAWKEDIMHCVLESDETSSIVGGCNGDEGYAIK